MSLGCPKKIFCIYLQSFCCSSIQNLIFFSDDFVLLQSNHCKNLIRLGYAHVLCMCDTRVDLSGIKVLFEKKWKFKQFGIYIIVIIIIFSLLFFLYAHFYFFFGKFIVIVTLCFCTLIISCTSFLPSNDVMLLTSVSINGK